MAANYLKVALDTADKHFIVYIDLPSTWVEFLKEVENIFPGESFGDFRKYWTDHEQDKIDIVDNKSYQIFLKMSPAKKIYLQNGKGAPKANEPLEVHDRVTCDVCETYPIVGFRYKCVQCPDFDLCGSCEAKREHKDHVMFRFPAPVKNIPFNRRFLRKMKKGCFIHPDGGEEGTSHHHHSRRHCRNNIFSSLYTMMQDMAEGTEGPPPEPDDEGVESGVEGEKSEKRKREKDEKKPRKSGQNEIPPIDPGYLKAGVEILGNFSEMFSKIINPAAVTVDIGMGPDSNEADGKSTPPKKDDSPPKESKPTAPAAEGKSAEKEPTSVGAFSAEYTKISIPVEEGASALTAEQTTARKPAAEQDKEESGWTVINPTSVTIRHGSTSSSSSGSSHKSGKESDSASKEGSPAANYAKLSKDLYDHLQREEKKSATVQVETLPPKSDERRAMIVYHSDKRINNAVHAMMGMGFSNEGNWLTYLLESVDGDIAQAIDLMKPVKN